MDLRLFFAVLNFGLFVGLLVLLLRRPLREFWNNRAEALRVHIAEAHERRSCAETQHAELISRVERMEQEMQALRDQLRENGELEKAKILADAQAHAVRLEEGAKRVGEQELIKARYRLKVASAQSAADLAERVIRGAITPADQERMASELLAQLATEKLVSSGGGLN